MLWSPDLRESQTATELVRRTQTLMLSAPITGDSDEREVYLPAGIWYNFNTNERLEGGKKYKVKFSLSQIPIFIKDGSLIPYARPVNYLTENMQFQIICRIHGAGPAEITLFEDDGIIYNFEQGKYNNLRLIRDGKIEKAERTGSYEGRLYNITGWENVTGEK